MPLVVEDGTGLPGAEAYLSAAALRLYCAGRGLDLGDADDDRLEQALRQAADFVDGHRFKGARATAEQALEFPRRDCRDWGGVPQEGVPRRVLHAAAEAAQRALSKPLRPDLDRGGQVASESVGPLSVSYFPGAPAGTAITAVDKLLAPLLREGGPVRARPGFAAPAGPPAFAAGMHDRAPAEPLRSTPWPPPWTSADGSDL